MSGTTTNVDYKVDTDHPKPVRATGGCELDQEAGWPGRCELAHVNTSKQLPNLFQGPPISSSQPLPHESISAVLILL